MTPDAAGVIRLTFPARAEYLLLARLALVGLARSLPFDTETVADLKLAVTEACGNVVRHAYATGDGHVSVTYVVDADRFDMIVEDEGAGLAPTRCRARRRRATRRGLRRAGVSGHGHGHHSRRRRRARRR